MVRSILACGLAAVALGGCTVANFVAPGRQTVVLTGPVIDETEADVPRTTRRARSGTDPSTTLRQAERERVAWLRSGTNSQAAIERQDAKLTELARLARLRPMGEPSTTNATTPSEPADR